MTLVEVLFASAIGVTVSVGLISLIVLGSRLHKSISYQEVSLGQTAPLVEKLNREIRMAATRPVPPRVIDASGKPALKGNRVEFSQKGEAPGTRAIELVSGDGSFATIEDNQLVYDPDTSVAGDEEIWGRWVSPLEQNAAGDMLDIEDARAFSYNGPTTPVVIWMRVGDPVDISNPDSNDSHSGPGLQGVEINITVGPRN
jgi:hypothetical protein